LPSVPLHCPRFPKGSDFIALDCPQFGNRIGDSCPALPWVPQRIGDRIGDAVCVPFRRVCMQASQHDGFIFRQECLESQSAFYAPSHTVAPARAVLSGPLPGAISPSHAASSPYDILGQRVYLCKFRNGAIAWRSACRRL